jgi:hypothetical protein
MLLSIVKFFDNISIVKPAAKVITIELAQNALSMEGVVRLFSTAFLLFFFYLGVGVEPSPKWRCHQQIPLCY